MLDTGLNGAQALPEYAETNEISALAYEVPPPGPAISPMAYELTLSDPPMLWVGGHPFAQCMKFSAEILVELIEILGTRGGG